jgi:hypothetical protein
MATTADATFSASAASSFDNVTSCDSILIVSSFGRSIIH